MLRKLYGFNIPREDLVLIYTMYWSIIASNVWFSSVRNEDREDIERVQKVACKIVLKDINYKQFKFV